MFNDIFDCLRDNGNKHYEKYNSLVGTNKQIMQDLSNNMKDGLVKYEKFISDNFGSTFNNDFKYSKSSWLIAGGTKTKGYYWIHYYKTIKNYKELLNITFYMTKNSFLLQFANNDTNYDKNNIDNVLAKCYLETLKEVNFKYSKLNDFKVNTSDKDTNDALDKLSLSDQINYLIKNKDELIKIKKFAFQINYNIDKDLNKNDIDYINLVNSYLPSLIEFYELFYDILSDKLSKQKSLENQEVIEEIEDKEISTVPNRQFWIYSPGTQACKWEEFYKQGIMAIQWSELGDLKKYSTQENIQSEMIHIYDEESSHSKSSHMVWQFANEVKIGDIIFVKKGRSKIIGRGEVISNYFYDANRSDDYNNVIQVNWTDKVFYDHPGTAAVKTLTNITNYTEYVESLNNLFVSTPVNTVTTKLYSKNDFLKTVYLDEQVYDTITNVLKSKMNIILQGPPGVGKTFMAKRLAYSIMGEIDEDRIGMIQFHQSYSYEDFVMGYKPNEEGFYLKNGCFFDFCKKAEKDPNRDYFFIIDEINRGNLSKIFGELFMLIENDKRGDTIRLMYQDTTDDEFSIPKNLYIIGMMNTADRSLALLDYALRRRFSFIEIKPAFNQQGFIDYQKQLNYINFDNLIDKIKKLNESIKDDDSLGEGFMIGHSYFTGLDPNNINDDVLKQIIEYEIIPLIKEYWFDETTKANKWIDELRGCIK